jgi:poly(3-hydroxybutyrate) depolymerase
MLYSVIEMQRAWLAGTGAWASLGAEMLGQASNPFGDLPGTKQLASAMEVFAHASAPRGKPDFGLDTTIVEGRTVAVREEIILRKPFGQLKRFVREGVDGGPKLLIVAPMSGHYATLLRGTVERMLPGHDVYITDWRDARAVPLSDGSFDLNDYVDYVIAYLETLGPNTHVLAVCQPSVPVLAATALMNAHKHDCAPATLTLMGGPIDTRAAPTSVNTLATERPYAWFERTVIATVPNWYAGAGRKVYPGWLQLSGFMTMNLGNHMTSHWDMFKHLVEGDGESADATKAFYDEYRSVCDMTAEFYLQTIDQVFQRHLLPKGEFMHRGERVDLAAITNTALLAIEGERDDISGLGQTRAALNGATKLSAKKKLYFMAEGAGHYGIFNGSKWRDAIAPVVEDWIARHNPR